MLEGARRDTTKDWKSMCIIYFFAIQREKVIMSIKQAFLKSNESSLNKNKWRSFKSYQWYPWITWSFYHSRGSERRNTSRSRRFECCEERSFQCNKEKRWSTIQKVYWPRSGTDRVVLQYAWSCSYST